MRKELFFYLNHFTRRQYFSVWAAAWLFYALWLTLCLTAAEAPVGSHLTSPEAPVGSLVFMIKQWGIAISAVFLLWGSLAFLGLPVRQTLFALFMLFLRVWSFVSPREGRGEVGDGRWWGRRTVPSGHPRPWGRS